MARRLKRRVLPRILLSAEGEMKRQWHIRRQAIPLPEGQQRWDRAYQLLLEWSRCPAGPPLPPGKETRDANCRVCAGIGRSGEDANGRFVALQFELPGFGRLTGLEKVVRPDWVGSSRTASWKAVVESLS